MASGKPAEKGGKGFGASPDPVPIEDLAYVYDGSLEGMLSAIFAAYERHEDPSDLIREGELQPRLDQHLSFIPTDSGHAVRVQKGIARTCGAGAFSALRAAAVSDEEDAASCAYRFVRYAMGEGRRYCQGCSRAGRCAGTCTRGIMADIAHPRVEPMVRIARAVANECERMRQFVRFNRMENDVWFARCNPKGSVVPLVMDWFAARFNTQAFVIYDEVHQLAGIFDGKRWYLAKTDGLDLPGFAQGDEMIERAWKRFYEVLAIDVRYNPELRRSFMPKRFWRNLPEMKEDFTAAQRKAAFEEASGLALV